LIYVVGRRLLEKIRKKIVDFLAGEVILHSVWLVFAASAFPIFAQSLFVSAAD